jgi:hypothetical protein
MEMSSFPPEGGWELHPNVREVQSQKTSVGPAARALSRAAAAAAASAGARRAGRAASVARGAPLSSAAALSSPRFWLSTRKLRASTAPPQPRRPLRQRARRGGGGAARGVGARGGAAGGDRWRCIALRIAAAAECRSLGGTRRVHLVRGQGRDVSS